MGFHPLSTLVIGQKLARMWTENSVPKCSGLTHNFLPTQKTTSNGLIWGRHINSHLLPQEGSMTFILSPQVLLSSTRRDISPYGSNIVDNLGFGIEDPDLPFHQRKNSTLAFFGKGTLG